MKIRMLAFAISGAAVLAACGAGTPATVEEANQKLKEGFADDDYEVTWVNAVAKEQPGEFRAFIDRHKKGDPKANETKLCDATIMSNSSSWSCQAATPDMMTQAAEMLIKDYTSRKIEVKSWELKRTGQGNAFEGHFEIIDPNSGQPLKIPCKGDQKEADFDINCEQS